MEKKFGFNVTGSPEFINRDTRSLLAKWLRNVLKGEETNKEIPKADLYR